MPSGVGGGPTGGRGWPRVVITKDVGELEVWKSLKWDLPQIVVNALLSAHSLR